MAIYEYQAFDNSGEIKTGLVAANNPGAARGKLRNVTDLHISQLTELAGSTAGFDFYFFSATDRKKQVALFMRQMAVLLEAGMPLPDALDHIIELTDSKKFKLTLIELQESISGGRSMWESLSAQPQFFSEMHINTIRAGETSGLLSKILHRLSKWEDTQWKLRNRVQSALYYPGLLSAVAIIIVIFLMVYIVPTITGLFAATEQPLPLVTRLLIGISQGVLKWWWVGLIGGAGTALLCDQALKTEAGRLRFDRWKLQIPVFKHIFRQSCLIRFSATFATLLSSGVDLLRAMDIVSKATGNKVFEQALVTVQAGIREGNSLARMLSGYSIFPTTVIKLIVIGETTGKLGEMLDYISDIYSDELESFLVRFAALIEPFIVIVMGLVVAFIAMAVLMPIFELNLVIK